MERGLKINKNTKLASDLLKTDVLVIDEATQLHKNFLDDLNEKLKDLKENNLPFGGISVILSGDFKQTLPIVIRSHQLAQIRVCIKKSRLWNLFKNNQFSFTTNMRLQQVTNIEDHQELDEFQRFLADMGKGNIDVDYDGNIRLPENLTEHGFETEELMQDAAVKFVHGNINDHIHDMDYMLNNVIICPHNRNVRKINDKIVEKMESPGFFCYSSDTTTNDCIDISEEVLNTFDVPGLPTHELHLKENMPVMLMRNMDRKRKLCNGTRLIVKRVSGSLLYTLNPATNEEVILPRFNLESDVRKIGFIFRRRQFPVIPAFAFTANKSQGQTIPGRVAIYLWDGCFSHGQLYVASTRATHPSHLKYFIKDSVVGTSNVVLKQVL